MCKSPPLQVDGETLPASLMLTLKTASGAPAQGRIEAEHLADHPAAVQELQEAVAVGARLGPLLVLDRLEVSLCLSSRSFLHRESPSFSSLSPERHYSY